MLKTGLAGLFCRASSKRLALSYLGPSAGAEDSSEWKHKMHSSAPYVCTCMKDPQEPFFSGLRQWQVHLWFPSRLGFCWENFLEYFISLNMRLWTNDAKHLFFVSHCIPDLGISFFEIGTKLQMNCAVFFSLLGKKNGLVTQADLDSG